MIAAGVGLVVKVAQVGVDVAECPQPEGKIFEDVLGPDGGVLLDVSPGFFSDDLVDLDRGFVGEIEGGLDVE